MSEPKAIETKTASGTAVSAKPIDGKVRLEFTHPKLGRVSFDAAGWVPPQGKTPGGVWGYANAGGKTEKVLVPIPQRDWDAASAAAAAHASALDAEAAAAAPPGTVPARKVLAPDGRMTHIYVTMDGREIGTVGGDDHLLYAGRRGITYLPAAKAAEEAGRTSAKREAENAGRAREEAKVADAVRRARETNAEVQIETYVEDGGDDHAIYARVVTPDGRVISRRTM